MKTPSYIIGIASIITLQIYSQDYPVETVIQTGHYAEVTSVAFSQDGKFAATGSSDKTIKLWEKSTGREIRSYIGSEGIIRFLSFGPMGKHLASIDHNYSLKIWEIPSSRLVNEISVEGLRILSADFLPDGKSIIIGTDKHHAYRWDLQDSLMIQEYHPDTADINMQKRFGYPAAQSVELSRDGKTLLTGSSDRTAFLFDVSSGKQIMKFKSDRSSCTSCTINAHFSPDAKQIVAGNMDSVFVWDVQSAKVIMKMEGRRGGYGSAYFSSDGKYIASSLYGDGMVWNASSGKLVCTLEGHLKDITNMQFHPSQNILITGSDDRTAGIWRIPSGTKEMSLQGYLNDVDEKILGDGYMYWIAFINEVNLSPDGKYLAIGKTGNLAKLLDFRTGKVIQTFRGHKGIVISLDFSSDGKYLATGAADGTAKVWEVESGKMLRSLPEGTSNVPYFSVDFSPDGKLLATGSWDGYVRIWDVETGIMLKGIRAHDNVAPYSVQFSHNGLYVISGGLDQKLKLFEIDTGREIKEFVGHTNVVSSVRRHPDGKSILSSSWDGKAKLWDLSTGMQTRKITAHNARVQSIAVDNSGKFMVTGSDDNTAMLWDIESGELIRTFSGHRGTVSSVNLEPDGNYLITGSHDGTIKTWDLNTGDELLTQVFIGENDWLVRTKQGYFDASEGAKKSIFFVQGTRIFNIDQFFDEFYKPGLRNEIFGRADPLTPPPSMGDRLKESPPPSVNIISPGSMDTVTTGQVNLLVELTNNGGGIEEIRLLNNGKRIPVSSEDVRKIKKSGKSLTQTCSVPLVNGMNTVQVSAYSEGRIESMPSVVQVYNTGTEQFVNLYLMAIGINEYENPALDLNYAKADAKAFSKAIENQGKTIFGNVEIHSLFDREATRENILAALEELSTKARPEDVFMFYYAGHGSMVDNKFYFVPTENVSLYQPDKLAAESIQDELMQQKFKNIAALKQLVILDACQSGGSTEVLAQRGAMEEKAMAQLSRSTGVHVLAAAGSEQYATEVASLGHGLFTYAILEALGGNADGAPRDGNVTVYELKAYINDQVPELSKQHKGSTQWPYTFSIGHDFPILHNKKTLELP
jgi:WD40 repeat protein